ncbi:hypothetical protein B9Z19DRAFT_540006 [Tuber borchii]|uniref:Uncharacterized protein n=1 Tax=Tuber borchii TaxID=42251 RepID=A0A2T6ZD86_TUBBO|nr:hypothetical protein B9Z19DRAFT_540006 [Tuber borchii]
MTEWVEECTKVLRDSKRSASSVMFMPNTAAPIEGNSMGSLRAPALIVYFKSETILVKALRPIRIRGYMTEVLRFIRDKQPIAYIVEASIWVHNPKKVKLAFEEQAAAKVIEWGWKGDKETKHHLLFQTEGLLDQGIQEILVDGLGINCVLGEGKGCYCCGREHDCFLRGTKCKKFTHVAAF